MTPLAPSQTFAPVTLPPAPSSAARPSRLMAGIYHDIGLAAVALGLELPFDTLEPATHDAVKRGARYIHLMPKRQEAPILQAAE